MASASRRHLANRRVAYSSGHDVAHGLVNQRSMYHVRQAVGQIPRAPANRKNRQPLLCA